MKTTRLTEIRDQAGQSVQLQLQPLWPKNRDPSKLPGDPRHPLSTQGKEAEKSAHISDGFAFSFASHIVLKTHFYLLKKKKKNPLSHSDSLFLGIQSTLWLCSLRIRKPRSNSTTSPPAK